MGKSCRLKASGDDIGDSKGMSFHTGSVSYARFKVTGTPPTGVDQAFLDTLEEHTLSASRIGVPDEIESGWVAGRHVFDERFAVEAISFGDRVVLGMRVDTNRVPSELKRAYRSMAEGELTEGSVTGFLSRREKMVAKETAEERCRNELVEGKHRKSKLVPILWDFKRQTILMPGFSDGVVKALGDLLHKSFDCGIESLSAGAMASAWCTRKGLSREYEDAKPSAFTPPPSAVSEDGEGIHTPFVPWSRQDPEPKDYLGNEFLLWLWHECEQGTGMIELDSGSAGVVIDRTLDMDCAWDATGKMTMRGDRVTRQGEVKHARKVGKWPRKAGLVVASSETGGASGGGWELTFQADRFLLTSVKLPKADDVETPRDLMEHRVESLMELDEIMVEMYYRFLEYRLGGHWSRVRQTVGAWMRGKHDEVKVAENEPAMVAAR